MQETAQNGANERPNGRPNGRIDGLTFPRIMGIVNVTPDSFSDGGLYNTAAAARDHALRLLDDGADILDIGGESTRPGAPDVAEHEEFERVLPLVRAVLRERPNAVISIDTTKYGVARAALDVGAAMLNDVSALRREPRLADLAAEYNADLVLMHSRATPATMQQAPHYDDVIAEVTTELRAALEQARARGAHKLIADVGIGFAKTADHNLQLLRGHAQFRALGVPLLLGLSRKSFIGTLLQIENPRERDVASLALHLLLIGSGAAIIRVHAVEPYRQAAALLHALQTAGA